jgi:cob(I)alamin adenosyltransferase
MKIYTRKGDRGQTRLVGGCLVSKADLRIESYGSVDELNSSLGVAYEELKSTPQTSAMAQEIPVIQNELFSIGSLLACEDEKMLATLPQIPAASVERLEKSIDSMSEELPPLKQFIIPGGSRPAALLHVARTICRRAERNTVKLFEKHPEVEPALIYLNRLSDYLFVAARFANHKLGRPDQTWVKP